MVNRSRTCTNPTPTSDGQPCSGDTFQTKLECISPCPSKEFDILSKVLSFSSKVSKRRILAECTVFTRLKPVMCDEVEAF